METFLPYTEAKRRRDLIVWRQNLGIRQVLALYCLMKWDLARLIHFCFTHRHAETISRRVG
jgi:hypothetical protein